MNQHYVGFGARFIAALIDCILLLIISLPIYYLFSMPLALLWLLSLSFINTISLHISDVIILFLIIVLALLPTLGLLYGYYVFYQEKYGQTLGKKVMRIKVVTVDGKAPKKSDFLIREIIGKFLSAVILGIGYLMVIWNPKKQALHDKITKTYVVYLVESDTKKSVIPTQ